MKSANYFSIDLFAHLLRIFRCVAAALVIGTLTVALQPCRAGDFGQATVVSVGTESTDVVNAQWIPTGSLNTGRYYYSATLLQDGRVLVSGGIDRTFANTASAELYDPATGVWTTTGSMHQARAGHTQTLLLN
jgi:hypothetical protein